MPCKNDLNLDDHRCRATGRLRRAKMGRDYSSALPRLGAGLWIWGLRCPSMFMIIAVVTRTLSAEPVTAIVRGHLSDDVRAWRRRSVQLFMECRWPGALPSR
jgi:hypothetical protein